VLWFNTEVIIRWHRKGIYTLPALSIPSKKMAKNGSMEEMIAKVELSAEIARIALACPTCRGPVNKKIQNFKDSHQGGGHSSLQATNDIGVSDVTDRQQYK
jgi:hypothetical protein